MRCTHPADLAPCDFRGRNPRFQGEAAASNQGMAETVRRVAARLGAEPAQVALAWVSARAGRLRLAVVPVPGTKHVRWLEQNVGALEVTLDEAAMAEQAPLGEQVVGARY